MVIVPVGGDYYSAAEWQAGLRHMTSAVREVLPDIQVQVLVMHAALPGGSAGHDQEAADYLRSLDGDMQEVPVGARRSYRHLVDYLAQTPTLVISQRMHAGIAGLCAGARVVLIGYERKHAALYADMDLREFYLDFKDIHSLTGILKAARAAEQDAFCVAASKHQAGLRVWWAS